MKLLDSDLKTTITGGVFLGLMTYDIFKGIVSYFLAGAL